MDEMERGGEGRLEVDVPFPSLVDFQGAKAHAELPQVSADLIESIRKCFRWTKDGGRDILWLQDEVNASWASWRPRTNSDPKDSLSWVCFMYF